MFVTILVLAAVLVAIAGIIVSFVPSRSVSEVDEGGIHTAKDLDAAMAMQRSMRIAELRRRAANMNYWSYGLLSFAFLMQVTALAVDRFAHPSIAGITIPPAFFIVLTGAARRREAQRQLDTFTGSGISSPLA